MRKLCMQALQTIKPAFFPVVLSLKKWIWFFLFEIHFIFI
jgi:hypothetical protein